MPTIEMGNDEFILYIRKREANGTSRDRIKLNGELGYKIWDWIHTRDETAEQIAEDQDCYWSGDDPSVSSDKLPKTAAQFRFDRELLPELYRYLDTLCDVT